MAAEITVLDLSGLGLSDAEIQTVLSAPSPQEQVRLLRRSRGRILEEVHSAQQRLDRLDYLIYQIRGKQRLETA